MNRREATQGMAMGLLATLGGVLGLSHPPVKVEVGSLLEFDDQGVPWRASTHEESPYFFYDTNLVVEVNGEKPDRCFEYDRRGGWVKCRVSESGEQQHFGRVTAYYKPPAPRG